MTRIAAVVCAFVFVALVPEWAQADSGDFSGGVVIGTSYAGVDSAPSNGLIVQGDVGIGTTSPANPLEVNGVAQFDSTVLAGGSTAQQANNGYTPDIQAMGTGASASFMASRFLADGAGAHIVAAHSRGASVGTQTALQSGDVMGYLDFVGSDGTSFQVGAEISASVDGSVSSGIVPGTLSFLTTNSSGTLTQDITILPSGNVGIGSTSPAYPLDVAGTARTEGVIIGEGGSYSAGSIYADSNWGMLLRSATSGATAAFAIHNSSDSPLVTILNGGDVGISNTSPAHLLHVGSSSASGIVMELQNSSGACTYNPGASSVTVSCSSDMRLKTDIRDSKEALAWIDGMRIRDFTVKATGERKTGVVAQEVMLEHPEMVHKNGEGAYLVDEPNPWKLVKAIQEQQKDIDELKRTIEQLQQKQ